MTNKNKKIGGIIRWTLVNLLVGLLIYRAVTGSEGAGNLLAFWAALLAIAYFIAGVFFDEKDIEHFPAPVIPETLDNFVDLYFISILVWHGWMFTGSCLLIVWIFRLYFRNKAKETK